MDPSHEVVAWSRGLRVLLAQRGASQRAVERRLGWAAGYLSQLLRPGRPPELKARHLLAVLDALDEPPATFFSQLYDLAPRPAADPSDDGRAAGGREAPLDLDEVERRIVAAIQRELDRREAARPAPRPGPPPHRRRKKSRGKKAR